VPGPLVDEVAELVAQFLDDRLGVDFDHSPRVNSQTSRVSRCVTTRNGVSVRLVACSDVPRGEYWLALPAPSGPFESVMLCAPGERGRWRPLLERSCLYPRGQMVGGGLPAGDTWINDGSRVDASCCEKTKT
jgi:hypothetical protein